MKDLFDVFGGRDNLRLMCGAKDFQMGVGGDWACFDFDLYRVDFHVNPLPYYGMSIKEIGRGRVVFDGYYLTLEQTREAFEEYTGHSLSF